MLDRLITLMLIIGVFLAAGFLAAGVQMVLARLEKRRDG